mmetsp:Transcript_40192/g.80568  ORF Transcript_40192/g.80568 Transcript_40192/m.80568 type:complete len:169 (-) Transcript_40192:155-661(-)|eukprot:CAMPEP_0174733968 /NCGR_PEP_ID=MMETSP1094-20130205/62352_1 /TAXON_ID=156173 /ORGANISM="Chrysochromulina brevifilum, Strain UTEX LB 985" /LENGTH=168 /DNA_ID=CAMNT_0015936701 /DNA_START=123 /DNA_END=629 /DNA_ORIENTATION=-
MVLPVIKLGLLAVKQVAKPVANRIKGAAIESETFRSIMVSAGQRLHRNVFQLGRIADGKATVKAQYVPRIKEQEALERGSDFLAEMVVYSITAGVVGVDQWYSKKKERQREAKEAVREAAKAAEVNRLREENEERQWAEFQRLHLTIAELQARLHKLEQNGARRWFVG